MYSLLIAVIYLIFISLGLPDSLLGSGWPMMRKTFEVPSSYAGYVSMTISFMTIISALLSSRLMRRFRTPWIVIASIFLTVVGLAGFSYAGSYGMLILCAVPYGLGAGAIDAYVNHYVASHYSSAIMNYLHCFYGIGAMISPNIMAAALKYASWRQGYRWTALLQTVILLVCVLSLPLWGKTEKQDAQEEKDGAGVGQALHVPGVRPTLVAFFAYCSGEAICFLWTSSYFASTYPSLSDGTVASFGSLIFGGLMLGRLVAGMISGRIGDRKRIKIGIGVELFGILLVLFAGGSAAVAAVGFIIIGIGMGPVYPAIQHMAPKNFGSRYSASVISLQMASAYTGSTFMPMIFGHLQQSLGIRWMPFVLLVFAVMNELFLQRAEKVRKTK